jgi:uncharacterized membrane protein
MSFVQPLLGTLTTISFIGNLIMAIAAILLLVFTARIMRRSSISSKGASV